MYSTGMESKTDWYDDADECSWAGLGCDADGSVTAFKQVSETLKGSIPADVGLWTSLTVFNVGFNELTGALPSSIAALSRLTTFDVRANRLGLYQALLAVGPI
jgi:hypothetical protein